MINVAHGISFFGLGLPGWPHEPGRAANRPLGCLWNQLAARFKGGGRRGSSFLKALEVIVRRSFITMVSNWIQ